MHIHEKGVLTNSNIYFNTPSSIAKSAFFYMVSAGEFFCNENYRVERGNFYSYLIMYVKNGSGFLCINNRTVHLHTNDVVFINCHKSHLYYTNTGWETLWLHFDGNCSKDFYDLLYNRSSNVIPMGESFVVYRYISMILDGLRSNKPLHEALISSHIHRMLTEMLLLSSNNVDSQANRNDPVLDAITYIHTNFKEKVSVDDIAKLVKISPFHFSRMFKKETGYSPYEYIIKTRIDHSKALLKKTKLNVKEIAYEVGFNSESNFVNTFRENVSLTPNEFRNTPI